MENAAVMDAAVEDHTAGKTADTSHPWGRGPRGCSPDAADSRDVLHALDAEVSSNLLPQVDLRPQCPPIYDQGALESCTGNGIAAAIQFNQQKLGETCFLPSRLFIYYNERQQENHVHNDNGAMIRNGIKTVVRLGAPREELWPYDETAVFHEPPPTAYAAAKLNLVTSYARVPQVLENLQTALAEGFPIVFRIATFPSIDHTASTGYIPMPGPDDRSDGGHCMLLVGYDNTRRQFLVRNSWGERWGQGGYGTIDYDYVCNLALAGDFWTIRTVTEKKEKPHYSPFEDRG